MGRSFLYICGIPCFLASSTLAADSPFGKVSQAAKELSRPVKAHIFVAAKSAARKNGDPVATFTLWKEAVEEHPHVFLMERKDFDTPTIKGLGVIQIEKPSGSLDVHGTLNIDNQVKWSAETVLPLEEDLELIAELYPQLKESMMGSEDTEEMLRIKILTGWYSLRFQSADIDFDRTDAKSLTFRPLTKESLMATMARFGYVEIHSKPDEAKIRIPDWPGWDKTSDDGYLPEGDVTIHLTKEGCETLTVTVEVKRMGTNEFRFTLQCQE